MTSDGNETVLRSAGRSWSPTMPQSSTGVTENRTAVLIISLLNIINVTLIYNSFILNNAKLTYSFLHITSNIRLKSTYVVSRWDAISYSFTKCS